MLKKALIVVAIAAAIAAYFAPQLFPKQWATLQCKRMQTEPRAQLTKAREMVASYAVRAGRDANTLDDVGFVPVCAPCRYEYRLIPHGNGEFTINARANHYEYPALEGDHWFVRESGNPRAAHNACGSW